MAGAGAGAEDAAAGKGAASGSTPSNASRTYLVFTAVGAGVVAVVAVVALLRRKPAGSDAPRARTRLGPDDRSPRYGEVRQGLGAEVFEVDVDDIEVAHASTRR